METPTTYLTRQDAVQREIIEVLDAAGGETSSADYDVDAIADEILGTIGEGTGYRYVVTANEDEFWEVVARHALTDDGEADDAVDDKVAAALADPAVAQALQGPVRLAWSGPAIDADECPVGSPGPQHDEWVVVVEVADPDADGEWIDLEALASIPAGCFPGHFSDVLAESFTGADADPTDPAPYEEAENRLIARLHLDRERLDETYLPW